MTYFRLLNKPLFGLISLLLLGAIIGVLMFMNVGRIHATRAAVMHTYDVLSHIDQLQQVLTDAESGARGYAVTRNAVYLKPYDDAVHGFKTREGALYERIRALHALTTDNPVQQSNIKTFADLADQKIAFMQYILDVVQAHAPADAERRLNGDDRGKVLMDQIKTHLNGMRQIEQGLLEHRVAKDKTISQMTVMLTYGLLALLLLIVSAAFLAIQQELNRRHKAEQALADNARFQNAILDNSYYMIIACHPDGTIRLFNKAAERTLGYQAAEVINSARPELFHDAGEMKAYAAELSRQYGHAVQPDHDVFVTKPLLFGSEEREWTYITKSGQRFPVLVSVTALRDQAGAVTGYVGIAKDISERKQIDKLKDEFISTVSHELRTPLTSIRGSLGLVVNHMRDQLTDPVAHLVHIAHKNTERLTRLINDILDIEKIEAGHVTVQPSTVNVQEALAHSLETMGGLATQSQVTCRVMSSPDLAVWADSDRLQQILDNLLSNAIKFSPPAGDITLSAVAEAGGVRITVADHGPGVPEAFRERIFTKFAQADGSASRQQGGTGLGLSICKSLVEAMDGRIWYDSRPGQTRFHIALPADHPTHARADAPATEGAADQIKSDLPVILHIEDDPDFIEMLTLSLRDTAMIAPARTLQQARLMLKNNSYDLAIVDIRLPDGNGLDLLPELADLSVPAMILSVYETPRDIKNRVTSAMIKSTISEEKIVQTIKTLIAR